MHNLLHNIVCILMRIGAIVIVMQIDTRDLISATDLTRNTAQLIRDAAEGRRFVVMNNSVPRAALIGIADLELLAAAASKDQRQHKVTAGLTRDELMDSIDPHEWTATKAQRRAEGRPMLLIPLGLSETDARPVFIDFNNEDSTHFAAVADARKGKTTLLRHLIMTLCENNTPEELQMLVVDPRRRLLGVMPEGYGHHVSTLEALNNYLAVLLPQIESRNPPDDVTGTDLYRRGWLQGRPECFIIVDNAHEFSQPGQPDPLQPIMRLLAGGYDTGLHFVGTWRSGGVARHLYRNGILAELKNLNTPGIVMSGPKEEGKILFEQKATALPAGRGFYVTEDTTELIQLPNTTELSATPEDPPMQSDEVGNTIWATSPQQAAAIRASLTNDDPPGITLPPNSTPIDPSQAKPGNFAIVDGRTHMVTKPGTANEH